MLKLLKGPSRLALALALGGIVGTAAFGASAQDDKPLTIMASIPGFKFPFYVNMMDAIRSEAESLGGITLIEADGQGSSPKQTGDIEAGITQGIDGLLIAPNEVDALAPALQEAVGAEVTVVTVDRSVENVEGLLAHVGADNVRGGELQAEKIMELFPDGARVMYLQGQPGAGPAITRSQGLHNVLDPVADKYPIVFEDTAQFDRVTGTTVTEAALSGLDEPPDVIVAANDDMILGAMEVVKERGLAGQVALIGYDALPEALARVKDGGLTATVDQYGGEQARQALRILVDSLRNGTTPAEQINLLPPVVITTENLDQAARIGELE